VRRIGTFLKERGLLFIFAINNSLGKH
jgi:hypothetical protein